MEGSLHHPLGVRPGQAVDHDPPQLYHLGRDPGEKTDVAKDNPRVLAEIAEVVAAHRKDMKPGEPQLENRLPAAKK